MKWEARPTLPPLLREGFGRHMHRAFGLAFSAARQDNLDAGVTRAAAALAEPDLSALLARLERDDPAALTALAVELTIGETYFFRMPQHFAFLRELLREAARARPRGALKLWSAGCATGEEAYSMAIAACEALGPADAARVQILGTDLNPIFLARACAGVYGEWSFREVSPEIRARWFVREEGRFRVLPILKEMVRFSCLNLVSEPALVLGVPAQAAWPSAVDVAFCRNVLIYFDAASSEPVAAAFARALAPGGWLITGPSDGRLQADGLELRAAAQITAYQRVQGGVVAARPSPEPSPEGKRAASRPGLAPPRAPAAPRVAALEAPSLLRVPAPSASLAVAPEASTSEPPLALARRLADRGDMTGALALLDRAVAADALVKDAYLLRATVLSALSDHARAAADAEKAILLDRNAAFAHMLAAVARASLGDLAAAQRSLRNAQKLLLAAAPEAVVPGAQGATASELLAACRDLARGLPGNTAPARKGLAVG